MNAKNHMKIGIVAAAGIPLIVGVAKVTRNYYSTGEIDLSLVEWDKVVMGGIAGLVLSSLPDWIEPATSPNHRKFFHSLAWSGALIAFKQYVNNSTLDDIVKNSINSALNVYLIHLGADFSTPKSLPLV